MNKFLLWLWNYSFSSDKFCSNRSEFLLLFSTKLYPYPVQWRTYRGGDSPPRLVFLGKILKFEACTKMCDGEICIDGMSKFGNFIYLPPPRGKMSRHATDPVEIMPHCKRNYALFQPKLLPLGYKITSSLRRTFAFSWSKMLPSGGRITSFLRRNYARFWVKLHLFEMKCSSFLGQNCLFLRRNQALSGMIWHLSG